ncbi:protein takeout-like isoform X1 [Toxorhynchites rutilus septentrionalis]|uniref:protein takeout-like isoform X1 n=1 Tax=Toxorhynchites rutilus septentrionalis TaxID=329112 RepID=UPI00247922F3|nr:protein takeout-like isoform X1 [Toxorhynchites rutilus septentrionalis]
MTAAAFRDRLVALVAVQLLVLDQLGLAMKFDVKPAFIKTCRFSDEDFVACSTEAVQGLFDKLVTGIEGLEHVGTIDPMKINKIRILQGDGPVSVNASLSKVVMTGFAKTKVVRNVVSSKDFSWETHIQLPKMRLEGNYHMQGRILVIPLNGHGKCWFEPSEMDIVMKTFTNLYERDNHVFYNVTDTKVDFSLTGLRLHMGNLFEGVKVLEDSTNQYLNDNWRPVSDALKPIIAKTIEDILLAFMQSIFHQIPAEYFVADLPRSG